MPGDGSPDPMTTARRERSLSGGDMPSLLRCHTLPMSDGVVERVEPDSAGAAMLLRLRDAQVVLDYALLRPVRTVPEWELHLAAFACGLEEASRGRGFEPPVDAHELPGSGISLNDFYGDGYDRADGRLLLKAGPKVLEQRQRQGGAFPTGHYGPFTWSNADESDRVVWWPTDLPWRAGYVWSFCFPPLGLKIPHGGVQQLFLETNRKVLLEPGDSDAIYLWNGVHSHSEYFAPGQDVSGAVARTLQRQDGCVVFIGCSADATTPF